MDVPARRRRPPFRIVAVASIVAVAAMPFGYLGVAIVSAHYLTRPSNRPARLDPRLVGPAERWEATTEDGLTLRGWYFPTEERRRLVVGVHGMLMNWEELAGVGRDLHARGFDVLLFDLRGHGRSDPARLSMGRDERADLRAALRWAGEEGFPPDRVGWLGWSLGASTILLEGLENPEIGAAVLDSPFGDLPELLDTQLSAHSGLPPQFNPGILLAAHLVYGVRTDDLKPARLASGWGERPMLVIHGEDDSIVPVSHGRAIARAVGESCELVALPGVEHVGAYRDHRSRYVDRVDRFFREHLEGGDAVARSVAVPTAGR
ncbi:alpha/beta hydrolase [Tautonia plasticadhaerens]|uniref:Alpha/beta hydrolase family protein n=1 Tax=Tautonia plasticadhaerens TaxID=2527974 RepID=A0A518HBC5_9BACT|nr:alpha/beta fold hydrolase [Tautonia plasticadhaerens]QDV38131.1 Alpha/beta hydrolase family protein [Tautonia plasticadhaerens]